MKSAYAVLALVLVCASLALAQVTAPRVFKPGDTITMTVKFSEKILPGSEVSVTYRNMNGNAKDGCRNGSQLGWDGKISQDGQTIEFSTTVPPDVVPGTFSFVDLNITSSDTKLAPGDATNTMDAPPISVTNDPCPKKVEVPSFKVTIKQ